MSLTPSAPSVFVVGAGRAATVLAGRMLDVGVPVFGLWGRTARRAAHAAQSAEVPGFHGPLPPIIGNARLILVAVTDSAVGDTAARLAASGFLRRGQVIAHTSGVQGPEALGRLPQGVLAAAFHPLQALTNLQTARVTLPGSFAAIEGPPAALTVLKSIARALGLQARVLPQGGRMPYHAAGVMASNYLVTLADGAIQCLLEAGLDRRTARSMLMPLMLGTLNNLKAHDHPRDALTGPIARGDIETVRRHLDALAGNRETRALYGRLGEATCTLSPAPHSAVAAIRKLFQEYRGGARKKPAKKASRRRPVRGKSRAQRP